MHNCKATRELFTELLLDGVDRRPDESLANELNACSECFEEFGSVKETLRVTSRSIERAAPTERYLIAYNASLKQKIVDAEMKPVASARPANQSSWLNLFFKSSVRIPVPVGVLLLLVFALAFVLTTLASRRSQGPVQVTSIVHVPVEVPVVREKVVTQVVYRERKRAAVSKASNRVTSSTDGDSTLAASQKHDVRPTLVGFKPLDEVKLTVIKGGSPDEK
jgi:hypothetical protein